MKRVKAAAPLRRQLVVPQPSTRAAVPLLLKRLAAVLPLNELTDPHAAREQLVLLTAAMAREGGTPLQRVLPSPSVNFRQWDHYPEGDAIDPVSKARWFYHAHPPHQRDPGEHGHFHIFLPLRAFDALEPIARPAKEKAAKVVHVAALTFDTDGLPQQWIATNQWVTEEYLFAADAVIDRLDALVLDGAGEAHDIIDVGKWLTLALIMCRADIIGLLKDRDRALAQTTPRNKETEILARRKFAL